MLKFLKNLLQSIALVPSVLALCFLLIAILISNIEIDYNSVSILNNFIFDDKGDVQYVLTFLIGGIFTLTIFSYTMVMNVLNRNINNYSPRLIPMILSEKHHQIILGFTSGTIIYAMYLSIVLNAQNVDYFPSIAAPLGVVFGIICILLFIYFIHSVSRSIHINYIIKEAFKESHSNIEALDIYADKLIQCDKLPEDNIELQSDNVGYLKMPSLKQVEKFIKNNNCTITLHKIPGEFVRKGELLVTISKNVVAAKRTKISNLFPIDHSVPMDAVETGFNHLVEVGVKAMSPAINDPGTALTSIDYLTQLFIERSKIENFNCFKISDKSRFYFNIVSLDTLRDRCYIELYNYVKSDPIVKSHFEKSLVTLNETLKIAPLSLEMLNVKTLQ